MTPLLPPSPLPLLQADLERKHVDLIKAYGNDLKDVQEIFTSMKEISAEGKYLQRDGPPLYVNMPPVSGALFWTRGLVERIEEPMAKLKATMRPMLDLEESKEVVKLHASLLASLREFESSKYSEWGKARRAQLGAIRRNSAQFGAIRRNSLSAPSVFSGTRATSSTPSRTRWRCSSSTTSTSASSTS